jgi:diguanylate cyclase (GGDEF)-like protein
MTLLGLGLASLFDAFDNVVWHHDVPIIPSAWLSVIAGAVIALWFEAFGRHAVERSEMERRLEVLATTDPLTGILNRRACLERGKALSEAAKRYGHPMTVMMLDIDHFKRVNDRHGHDTGDDVLRLFVSVVGQCLRQVDVFGRMGGEEFVVLMPETAQKGAMIAAERIRDAVEQAKLELDGQNLSVTVSVGAVVGTHTVDEALKLADEALYRAKSEGRNRVALTATEGDSI